MNSGQKNINKRISDISADFEKHCLELSLNVTVENAFKFLTKSRSSKSLPHDFYTFFENEKLDINEELKDIVKKINPYYKFDNKEKNIYYHFQYKSAVLICEKTNELIADTYKVYYYVASDEDENVYLTKNDFGSGGDPNVFENQIFDTLDSAKEAVFEYLKMYRFLDISKNIAIHCFNGRDLVIKTIKLDEFGMEIKEES